MEYRTREGTITAVDSETAITGLYGVSTASAVQVPANTSRIIGMMVSFQTDSAANGASTFAVKISGDGLAGVQQIVVCGGVGVDGATVSAGSTDPVQQIPLDLTTVASNQISISAFMGRSDTGSVECAVTLIFQ